MRINALQNGFSLIFAIGLIAAFAYFIRKIVAKPSAPKDQETECSADLEMAKKVFKEACAELEKNAKGFALYKALLEHPLDLNTEEKLYAEYGKCLMDPNFASVPAAEQYEKIFDSPDFLELVKRYLVDNGVQPGPNRFTVFNQMNDLAMKLYASEMKELVQKTYSGKVNF